MRIVFLASAFALAALPATAADLTVKETVIIAQAGWAGAYAGVWGAASLQHFDIYELNIGDSVTEYHWVPTLGAFAGYNWQSNNIVYGIEGELG